MKIKELLFFLTIIITLSFLSSCGAIAKGMASTQYTVKKGAIPEDFGKDNSTLVCVLTGRKSRDKYLIKHVKNIYKGKYVFASKKELSTKYSNTNEYRYLFTFKGVSGPTTIEHNKTTNKVYANQTSSSNYFLVDRSNLTSYNSTFHSGYFSKLIQAYMKNIEKQRLKNQLK